LPLFGLFVLVSMRPQDCDPIFGDCVEEKKQKCDPIFDENCTEKSSTTEEPCDPIFGGPCAVNPSSTTTSTGCFTDQNEIEQAIFDGDTRQAFPTCDNSACGSGTSEGWACVPYWNCANSTIITDGKGITDVRSDDVFLDLSDRKCDKLEHVCCKKPNFRAGNPNKGIERPPKTDARNKINTLSKCGRIDDENIKLTGTDENTAQPGEFPHMCVIYRFEKGQRIYVGGGSLIAENKILTVAHKFYVFNKGNAVDLRDSPTKFQVRCGEHNVKLETELLPSQETKVVDIIIHPEYNPNRLHNNLAILRTELNFVYQRHIGPVCLPRPGDNFVNEKECWSSGWGADSYSSFARYSDILKKVQMPVVPSSQCEKQFKNHERFQKRPNFKIHNSWVCIGGEKDSDTCKGDGGSPHVCKRGNNWYQVGAVAWGIGCGDEIPSVYSSVPDSMCWIDWVMSCIPRADFDIDNVEADDLDIRIGDPDSKNGLSYAECGEWMEKNSDLGCRVAYKGLIVDERKSVK